MLPNTEAITKRVDGNRQYHAELSRLPALTQLEADWRELESASACSFFLTWSWIGTWLYSVHENADLRLYRCYCNDELIAMAIIGMNNIKRRLCFHSQTLTLNELDNNTWNMHIEYNGVLIKSGHEIEVLNRFLDDIQDIDLDWDEIQITNIPQKHYSQLSHQNIELRRHDELTHTLWIAPLNTDTTTHSIIAQMSKKRRWQIRRTFKEYEKEGSLNIHGASTLHEALNYFQEMGELHTHRWQRIGIEGTFSRPRWVEFHQNLIRTAFDRGEIQLLRITCGSRSIGYVYNFLWRDSVYMLQSGFATEPSNLLRPGYVSHILAMQFNASRGAQSYDFMIGDSEYKRALARPSPPLISVKLQKPCFKFFIENSLVTFYRALRPHHLKKVCLPIKKAFRSSAQGLFIAVKLESMSNLFNLADIFGIR